MNAVKEKPGWSFYLLWVLWTFLGVPITFFVNVNILSIIILLVGDYIYVGGVRHITEDYLGMYTFIPLIGLFTGVIQYALLRRYLPRMGWWVAATLGGWLLGWILSLSPGWLQWVGPLFNLDLAFLVMGLSIGVGQWLLLRRYFPRASWWIGANVAGWAVLALFTQGNSIGQFGLFGIGLIPACATALTLALLMRQSQATGAQTGAQSV